MAGALNTLVVAVVLGHCFGRRTEHPETRFTLEHLPALVGPVRVTHPIVQLHSQQPTLLRILAARARV